MNASDAHLLELALKKQRLQFTSAQLREDLAYNAAVLVPLCSGIDQIRAVGRWLRQRPAVLVAVAVAVIVAQPRRAWRWARRGLFAWQAWQRVRHLVEPILHARR